MYLGRHLAAPHHASQVTHQAKAGDIGTGVDAYAGHDLRGGAVQGGHGGHRPLQHLFGGLALLAGGGDDAGAQGLGQHQHVAGTGPGVGHLLAGLHQPHHGKSVFGLWVIHRVPAHNEASCLGGLGVPAPQHLRQHRLVQRGRETHDVQGQQGLAPHGVDVAQGVGGGNGAELDGVVGNGREKVHSEDQRRLVVQAIDGGIVPGLNAHQEVRVGHGGQPAQDLDQVLNAELGGSTGAVGQFGQAEFLALHLPTPRPRQNLLWRRDTPMLP